jgi:hypothetical protein
MKKQLNEEFKRMQELAGIKETKEVNKNFDKLKNYLNSNNTIINNDSKFIDKYGRLKIHSNEIYDFGGSENPVPNSIVVDIEEPEGNNEFIEQNLEEVFSLPPKEYINLTSVLHFIKNKNNLFKSINNSLKQNGILIIKTSLNQILKILPYLSNYTPLEAQIIEKEILQTEYDSDAISIVFQKS